MPEAAPSFANALVDRGLLQGRTLIQARARQQIYGGGLDTVLLETGSLAPAELMAQMARQKGLAPAPAALLQRPPAPQSALISPTDARTYGALVFRSSAGPDGGDTIVALVNFDYRADALTSRLGAGNFLPYLVLEIYFEAVFSRLYQARMAPRYRSLLGRLMGPERARAWLAELAQESPGDPNRTQVTKHVLVPQPQRQHPTDASPSLSPAELNPSAAATSESERSAPADWAEALTRARQKGRQEGRLEGRQEGRLEARKEAALGFRKALLEAQRKSEESRKHALAQLEAMAQSERVQSEALIRAETREAALQEARAEAERMISAAVRNAEDQAEARIAAAVRDAQAQSERALTAARTQLEEATSQAIEAAQRQAQDTLEKERQRAEAEAAENAQLALDQALCEAQEMAAAEIEATRREAELEFRTLADERVHSETEKARAAFQVARFNDLELSAHFAALDTADALQAERDRAETALEALKEEMARALEKARSEGERLADKAAHAAREEAHREAEARARTRIQTAVSEAVRAARLQFQAEHDFNKALNSAADPASFERSNDPTNEQDSGLPDGVENEEHASAPVTSDSLIITWNDAAWHAPNTTSAQATLKEAAQIFFAVQGGPREVSVVRALNAQYDSGLLFAATRDVAWTNESSRDNVDAWLRLIACAGATCAPALLAALEAEDALDRLWAATALSYIAAETLDSDNTKSIVSKSIDRIARERRADVRDALMTVLRLHKRSRPVIELARGLRKTLPQAQEPEVEARARGLRALAALEALRDDDAVPPLIELLDARMNRVKNAAHKALATLTGHDFGLRPKAWTKWWKHAATEPRWAWLVDGLDDRAAGTRIVAARELTLLTNRSFGYHFDLAPSDRVAAQKRWAAWCADNLAE